MRRKNRNRIRSLVCLSLFIFLIWSPREAVAFPEMVRAGYTNCTACHVSPAGGGILTDYGRGLSAELLSTWGSESEAQVGHGLFGKFEQKEEVDRWFGLGGDVRGLQAHVENENVKAGRWVWMQATFDIGIRIKTWTAVLSTGQFDRRGEGDWEANSSRYYLMKQMNDENSLRVGRFIPNFGLNIPEHISPTRGGTQGNGLGFGIFQERDVAEWNYVGELWSFTAGYARDPRDGFVTEEAAGYGQIQRSFNEHYKIGASFWSGSQDGLKRRIVGLHAMLGFSKKFYALTEVDAQIIKPDVGEEFTGIYGYHKLGYEFHKGVHAVAVADHSQNDLTLPNRFTSHWGGGIQFYPRPHWEFTAMWTRELVKASSDAEGDYAWVLLHYYL